MWDFQRAWQHFGTTHIICSMLIHMSGDIKFSVLCTLSLEEFDLIFSSRGRWQLWQNLEAKGDPLIFHHLILLTADCHFDTQASGWFFSGSGKYHPRGTNVLLCTVVGNNWERVVTLSEKQVLHSRKFQNSGYFWRVQAMQIFIFQLKQEIFGVLKSMYGTRAVMPEEVLVPDWHRCCRQSVHIFDTWTLNVFFTVEYLNIKNLNCLAVILGWFETVCEGI